MIDCKPRREVILGSVATGLALGLGFLLGTVDGLDRMPPPPDLIAGAEAHPLPMQPLPLPADAVPAPAIDREIDGLFFWPAGPRMSR